LAKDSLQPQSSKKPVAAVESVSARQKADHRSMSPRCDKQIEFILVPGVQRDTAEFRGDHDQRELLAGEDI
jgi:hypothetical protein